MIFIKYLFTACLFYLVLCDNLQSQSTFFLGDQSLTLVSDYNFTHGFGAEPLSGYNEGASYKKACDSALEDLNSNIFLSVYIEQFKTGANYDYAFPELSVRDSVLTYGNEIVKVDSFDIANQAYCIATVEEKQNSKIEALPNLEKLKVGPVKMNNVWYAMGSEKGSRYNLFIPWVKSKNNALKDLTRTITTLIQSSVVNVNYNTEEFTYLKSNVIFKDIIVARRFISSDNEFVSIVAVKDSDIVEY